MQHNAVTHNKLIARAIPAALSMLVAVSAVAVAAPPAHQKAAPAKKQEMVKPKAAPAKKDAADSDKEKEAKDKAAIEKEIQASLATATKVESLDLLKDPTKFMNKKVTFTGTFNRFADVGLDYKKAFRDSRDYVTFFILRPDVTAHNIPMAEMKLFFPRKKSTEVMDLETGDKIQIVGTQFSNAMEEPWVDVEHIKLLQKTEKPERHKAEF